MVTSRRAFLASVAAALVLDPERALWVPGKKKIFLPTTLAAVGVDLASEADMTMFALFNHCPPNCPACIEAANAADQMFADLYRSLVEVQELTPRFRSAP